MKMSGKEEYNYAEKNPNKPKGRGVQVSISVACFVPKPMTPFQFVGQDTPEQLREKQQHLLRSVKSRKISVSYHDSRTSFLEAVFAKGDRRLSRVLVEAYRRGCFFDSWEEQFHYDTWLEVFRDLGFDTAFYAIATNSGRHSGSTLITILFNVTSFL